MTLKNKDQRVSVFIDVQNLYHSAKNLHQSRVNFREIIKTAVAGRKLVRAFAYVVRTKTGEEKPFFDALGNEISGLTFGTDEYRQQLEKIAPTLEHHYKHNSHHPQHYENGINGMCLLDLIEMICDWKAAEERHDDGDIHQSIAISQERFGISDQLTQILTNTANRLWPDSSNADH